VNLAWAVERMRRVCREHWGEPLERLRGRLEREALAIHEEDVAVNRALGRHGAPLLPDEGTVLTYCNAGALATAGYGTALGVIRRAREVGKRVSVIACETRPFLQGSRLTAWELHRDRIPCTLVTDNMVGHLMQRGAVDAVIVGTDRTAANGDVANKIGTYTLAALAARHRVPFYVAAPTSSIDLDTARGADIPIEERRAEEVTHFAGRRIAPNGIAVYNPAFDVTPARLVTAIITERGVARPPYRKSLSRLVRPLPVKRRRRQRGGG
jgi:methylthioribose-1-phosphate isomerase